jgi:hypothetical protein
MINLKIQLLAALAFVWLILPASAQQSQFGTGSYSGLTVGATDSIIVPSIGSTSLSGTAASRFLDIANQSATATVCLNFGAVATISGTACAAGEITLPPLPNQASDKTWQNNFVPSDVIHAIASAASTPITVGSR